MPGTAQRASGRPTSKSSSAKKSRRASSKKDGSNALKRSAQFIADNVWGDRSARVGLGARSLVYLVLAYIVARIATGGLGGGSTNNPASGPGVAQAIAQQTGGRVVLFILAVGLVFFTLFSVLDTVLHHNDEDPAIKRWGNRALSFWGFILYGAFAVYCFKTAFSPGTSKQSASQSDQQQTQWSAKVLRWPGGPVWLGLAAAIVITIGVFLAIRAIRVSFKPRFEDAHMSARAWRITEVLGIGGEAARAEMFGIVGYFLLSAAIENDPQRGQGVDGSARELARSAIGPYLLWILAVGLVMYALFMLAEARYRDI